jgi:4-amino-4-deoxy-L-arabinose transferase-like glycosyltransferase
MNKIEIANSSFLNKWKYHLLIIILAAVLFIPNLGLVHLFDWDEINFAEAAREMIQTGDYSKVMIDYKPFHEKPPVFIWSQVLAMKIFGVGEFAARLPNALIGICTLLVVFSFGKKLYDEKFGLLWVLAYVGSFLPHFYFKTGIIDPFFNLFMYLGVYYLSDVFFARAYISEKAINRPYRSPILAGIFVALAIMTKGPVGYLLPTVTMASFYIIKRKEIKFPYKDFIIYTITAAAPALLWYAYIIVSGGMNLVDDFLMYQIRLLTTNDAGHGGPIYYHFLILLLGCFPASIFALRGFIKDEADNRRQHDFKLWNIIVFLVVLIIFSLVKTKIVHYSSLAYFPITFLAANAAYRLINEDKKWKKSTTWLVSIFGFIWSFLLIAFPLIMLNKDSYMYLVKDKFTRELLKANVQWSGMEVIPGLIMLAAIAISLFYFMRKELVRGFVSIYSGISLSIFLILPLLAPKIEPYTQGAPIAFYQSLIARDAYVEVLGFKSYAHLFYNARKYENSSTYKNMDETQFENWLRKGAIDKDAYFLCKIGKEKRFMDSTNIRLINKVNGFSFLKRDKVK